MRSLIAKMSIAILSSSVVERSAVNRLVVGSNPTWGVFENLLDGSASPYLGKSSIMMRQPRKD